jgi:sugar transferase (PEP-CTERM/EpsH1 system associated)
MSELLFLTHRIPYPPIKGDKIRSWRFLQHLASTRPVHLACFIDDPEDWKYTKILQEICSDCHFESIPRSALRLHSIGGLVANWPLSFWHYRKQSMALWIERIQKRHISDIFVYSGAMAQYVPPALVKHSKQIIDFVDVDSEKWRQYSRFTKPPLRWIYSREARVLENFEQRIARGFDANIFVSPREAELFRQRAPECRDRVFSIPNGVEPERFDPDRAYDRPAEVNSNTVVFVGAMDYWPNVDAVIWFTESILPIIRERRPNTTFTIVGADPTKAVKRLASRPGVTVIGRVPEVQPYLAHAGAIVTPLRVAQGVPNKLLEAMAMAKPVITTSLGIQGLSAVESDRDLLVADDANAFACAVEQVLKDPISARELGGRARVCVMRHYSWSSSLEQLDRLVSNGPLPELTE